MVVKEIGKRQVLEAMMLQSNEDLCATIVNWTAMQKSDHVLDLVHLGTSSIWQLAEIRGRCGGKSFREAQSKRAIRPPRDSSHTS